MHFMAAPKIERLSPTEELAHIMAVYGGDGVDRIYSLLTETFNVLQSRSQMLLSLITITLTITGFSGPQIAASSLVSRVSITFGLVFVLGSALILMTGPLQLKWSTQIKAANTDEKLLTLIRVRNYRTRRYHLAAICLIIGLVGYVSSLVSFLLTG